MTRRHRHFAATSPNGHEFTINGDPNMSPTTLAALGALMDAAYEHYIERDGIAEAYAVHPEDVDPAPHCPVCNGEMEWIECESMGCEDGTVYDDTLLEEDPLWYSPGDTESCSECGGKGGSWLCFNDHLATKGGLDALA